MITEHQQEQASLYAVGALSSEEGRQFEDDMRNSPELRDFVISLQQTIDRVALSLPPQIPSPSVKERLLNRIRATVALPSAASATSRIPEGLQFLAGAETSGWKQLPVPGAWIKLLSFERARGYAVLLGKLDPGTRYPAHVNAGPEDFYVLTGDLRVGDRVLGPGDFHHADAGSYHEENWSAEGCTLLAVLTADDPLVEFAMT